MTRAPSPSTPWSFSVIRPRVVLPLCDVVNRLVRRTERRYRHRRAVPCPEGARAMTYQAGRHFLQVPGPSNIPDRILRAIAQPVLDHRGPAWAKLQAEVFERVRPV